MTIPATATPPTATPPTNLTVQHAASPPTPNGLQPASPAAIAAATLTSIDPITATGAGAPLLVTCTGTNFVPGTRAYVAGVEQDTTVVSATSLTFMMYRPASAGTVAVTVKNTVGAASSPQTFTFT